MLEERGYSREDKKLIWYADFGLAMSEEYTTEDKNLSVYHPVWRSKGAYSILLYHVLTLKYIWISVNIVLRGAEIREQENREYKIYEERKKSLSTFWWHLHQEMHQTLSKDYIKGIPKTKCIYITMAMYFP